MYRGLFIADIHIGAMSYEETYKGIEYLRTILKIYTKESLLDFIILGGDFFDKQIYANDPFIKLAQKLMLYIITSAKVVRVINGTKSHDAEQYGIFDTLKDDLPILIDNFTCDFKVINTVSEETILEDLKVLYIPEEYIFDKAEYYKEFLSKEKEYDYIFGHGVIEEGFKFLAKDNIPKEKNRRRAPLFKSKELERCCKGHVLFGHYHVHSEYLDGSVSYSGSLFRWIHGEEEDKGFFKLTKTDDGTYKKDFIINDQANKYITIRYPYDHPIYKEGFDLEEFSKKIEKKKQKEHIYHLKLVFNLPEDASEPESFMKFWKNRFKEDKSIKVEFTNGYVESIKKLSKKEIEDSDDFWEKHKILFDKNAPEEVKLSYFLKEFRGVEMSPEKIKYYLDEHREEE